MAGRNYCFEERLIAAQAWQTDSRPGFLINVPVSDPELVDCNKHSYLLSSDQFNPFPSVHVSFGEDKSEGYDSKTRKIVFDSTEKYFDRMYKSFYSESYGGLYGDVIIPFESLRYYGMNCLKTKADAVYHKDFECHVGKYGDIPPPHFFSCDRDESVPFPGCRNTMFYRDMRFGISYNKKCAPHHALIRQRVVEYIDRMEIKRGDK
jgi:hypothetical protein